MRNVSFGCPEIYIYIYIYFEGVIFICRSDSQRIEHCDGTSEGIEHYFHNEFYRMLFP